MRVSPKSAVLYFGLSFVILIAAAWSFGVPTLLTPTTFVASAAVLTGLVWVSSITYMNARPASSLAQSLYDADDRVAAVRTQDRRNGATSNSDAGTRVL